MMNNVWYILDFYTNKNFFFLLPSGVHVDIGDKCIVRYSDGEKSQTVGIYIGSNHVGIDREVSFESLLSVVELQEFDDMQRKARDYFPIFKSMFKKSFIDAIRQHDDPGH